MLMMAATTAPCIAAQPELLSAEQAFPLSIEALAQGQAQLSWQIPADYYLYQHSIQVQQQQIPLALEFPAAEAIHDENYGNTHVFYDQLKLQVPVQASARYQVTWQGCAKDRLCYPIQQIEFSTDQHALVELKNTSPTAANFLELSQQQNVVPEQPSLETTTAQDQRWFSQLAENSFGYGMLLFFGLGFLLAFTPCSLPMLPILSALLVRDRKGMAAWAIALTFVSSMALVYSILGLIASSAGLNFQRWLQQPITLMAFSGLFVLFAFNLFGLFEIRLPQGLLTRLDRVQGMQKGGSFASAAMMGMLSALLVGPCMTAPLAGALLFISQTQQQWQGAILLFSLGFGMGTPLLFASILGSRILPKAGHWMNQVKILFGFIMLAVALYFVRPLMSTTGVHAVSLVLGLSFIVYVAYCLWTQKGRLKWLYWLVLIVVVPGFIYSQYQQSQRYLISSNSNESMTWQVVRTAAELNTVLADVPNNQPIVIDVYADWCVACQPIEHVILKSAQVQSALHGITLIKLDLSQYDASHQQLLNDWEILGPPTYLFLNAQQQEKRGLRLTGAFTEAELLQQLAQLKQSPL